MYALIFYAIIKSSLCKTGNGDSLLLTMQSHIHVIHILLQHLPMTKQTMAVGRAHTACYKYIPCITCMLHTFYITITCYDPIMFTHMKQMVNTGVSYLLHPCKVGTIVMPNRLFHKCYMYITYLSRTFLVFF